MRKEGAEPLAIRMMPKCAWRRTGRYFKRCAETGERVTLSGLALALGCGLGELREADFEPPETKKIIKKTLVRVAHEQELFLLEKGSARDWLTMGTYVKSEERDVKSDGGDGGKVYVVMSEEAKRFGR